MCFKGIIYSLDQLLIKSRSFVVKVFKYHQAEQPSVRNKCIICLNLSW